MSDQNWFAFWPCWPNFGPLMATKWLKIVVSDHYLKKYSCKPIQTCCVHLFGECSELICFLATFAKFWLSSGYKMDEIGGFRLSSQKVFTQSNSNLVWTLIEWMLKIVMLFGHIGQIWPGRLYWTENDRKWWFPTIIWKSIHAIQLNHGVYIYWVSVQKRFAFWQCWPNFRPCSGHKITGNRLSDHNLKKYSCNPIQTWCVHLGECSDSELFCYLATLTRFWHTIGLKINENGGFRPLSEKAFM